MHCARVLAGELLHEGLHARESAWKTQEKCGSIAYLWNLIGVEVQQQLLLVVTAQKHDLFRGAGRQNALDCRPQELEHAGSVEEEAAAQTFWVKILRVELFLKILLKTQFRFRFGGIHLQALDGLNAPVDVAAVEIQHPRKAREKARDTCCPCRIR